MKFSVKSTNESAPPKLKAKSNDNNYSFIRGYDYYRKDGESK